MGHKQALQPAELCAAFAEFEQASNTLAGCYGKLEQRVADLTEALTRSRAALERELGEKERLAMRLGALLDALPGGVVVLDGLGRVTQHNPAAVDLLGALSPGEPWIDVVQRAFTPRWDDGHDISLADGRRVNVATEALQREPGQILLIKDVTETRRLQEQLNHHRRLSARTELAAALAHQVRTPLTAAMLQLGNLNRAASAPEARSRAAEKALEAMRQLERLVEDMLSYARGGVFDATDFAAGELLTTLEREAAALASGSAFHLEVADAARDARLKGNQSALLSMMLNLVHNSRSATADCGRLRISAAAVGARLVCRFADDGPGIPKSEREHVFEPFFTTRRNGTGLGLPVALGIARAHGGDLALDPEHAPGACFVLSLPLLNTLPAAATAGDPTTVNRAGSA